jgi:hypothetical protein
MHLRRHAAAAVATALLASLAHADVVTTKEGLVLEGPTTRAGTEIVVATEAGDVRLPADAVASWKQGEGPREAARRMLAALPADAAARYRLAASLDAQGLADLARAAYEAVLVVEADHPAARRALGHERDGARWVPAAEARRRSGLVLYEGRWLLPAELDRIAKSGQRRVEVRATDLARAMRTAATASGTLARAAATQVAAASPEARLATATGLLVHSDARVRARAASELGRLGDESALRPLWAVAARDREEGVRRAAVDSLASFGRADVAIPLVRALGSEHPSIVAHAAQALGWLGDRHAVAHIVRRVTSHGSSPGSHFAQITQQAYVQDFDVEVAQTSFIADPIIGVVQDGAVQDVKVLDLSIEWTWVETVLIDSFRKLTKAEASSPAQIAAWWKENRERFPDFPPITSRSARRAEASEK